MDIRPHPITPPLVRFMALIKVSTEHFYRDTPCWDWQGSKSGDGYGQFTLEARRDRKRVRIAPYRFIWEHFNGPMPAGLEPDHLCNRRGCCSPEHIEPVTHSENQKRSYQRGRKRSGIDYVHPHHNPSRCKYGHEYTPVNTTINVKGARQCRACNRRRCAAYQASKRVALSA